ncbi:MAG: NnrS family protein [Burkholderiales bacterium]|nr:MAG: NnrS family protein [Burkholderiales bacterium]
MIQLTDPYRGPAWLGHGFRPFFLLAAAWAALSMALWLSALIGGFSMPGALSAFDWHVHELLYGFVPAVMAGFLLTAVANWTGRAPVAGMPLLALALCWCAGRIAVLASTVLGPIVAALLDLSFLAALAAVLGRELLAARNRRNLKVLALLVLLLAGNALFHAESIAAGSATGGLGTRVGITAVVLLIMLIGGRIVPAFTRSWLAKRGHGRSPAAFDRLDVIAAGVAGVALAAWCVGPSSPWAASVCLLAAVLHAWRLGRWAGERTLAEPLVLALHLGYAFVPLGFALVAAAALWPAAIGASAALHAWTAGAVGVMTLAVMTRASLGHTGRALHATRTTSLLYVLVTVSALARIAAGAGLAPLALLGLAALTWMAAFSGFALAYGPMLVRPRLEP